jgi:hypothetical protein
MTADDPRWRIDELLHTVQFTPHLTGNTGVDLTADRIARGRGFSRSAAEYLKAIRQVVSDSVPRVSRTRITGMACCRLTRRTASHEGDTRQSSGSEYST